MLNQNTPEIFNFNNGITLLYRHQPHMQTFVCSVNSRVGSRHESMDMHGATHLCEHVIFRGSKMFKNSNAVDSKINSLGDDYNAATSYDTVGSYGTCASIDWQKSIDFLIDTFFEPNMTDAGIDAEREIVLQEISQYADDISHVSCERAFSTFWKSKSLGRNIIGSEKSVRDMNGDALRSWWGDTVTCGRNIIVSAAGPIPPRKVIEHIGKLTSSVNPGRRRASVAVKVNEAKRVQDNRDCGQVYAHISYPGYPASYKKIDAYILANQIIGEGSNSILYKQVREKMKACYFIQSSTIIFEKEGIFSIMAVHDPNRAVLNCIKRTLGNFEQLVSMRRFNMAKNGLIRHMMIRRDCIGTMLHLDFHRHIHNNKHLSLEQEIEKIKAVTYSDVIEEVEILLTRTPNVYRIGPLDQCVETTHGIYKHAVPSNH